MPSSTSSPLRATSFLLVALALTIFLPTVTAFGSGSIPDTSYLKGRAFRHGEIEETIEKLAKVAAAASGGGVFGAIAGALLHGGGGERFTGLDVKRIYFGNWLRDLSQVCDIAGFKALTGDSLVICIMVLGFLSFGYATREFEVTKERLAVYLLTEHIDNPLGYGEGEDARQYDSRLRGPIDPRELEIDESNGMKKYIATENQGFGTSTEIVRKYLKEAITLCREARQSGDKLKEYEAFRLLGTGLHTLEDFSAHSNYCELMLKKLGHKEVFAHVGDNVKVRAPNGEEVSPLVTGTFGGADFMHSMLGEAGDKLSQSSIADLTTQMDKAKQKNPTMDAIKALLSQIGGGNDDGDSAGDKLNQIEEKKRGFDLDGNIDSIAPEEVQKQIWEIFKIRDDIFRSIEEKIEQVPGLSELLDGLSNTLAEFVLVNIDPFVRPILIQATQAIAEGSKAVISGHDQWTVFTDANASDPTHSVIAKDHFGNILNDPAGNVSIIVVKYTVNLIVEAWANDEDPDRVIDKILEAIHHPNFATGNSQIQNEMAEYMQKWVSEMDEEDRRLTISSLSKEGVRAHRNQRKASENAVDPRINGGVNLHDHSGTTSQTINQNRYDQNQDQASHHQASGSYGRQQQQQQQYSSNTQTGYGSQQHQQTTPSSGYGRQDDNQSSAYGRQSHQQSSYAPSYSQQEPSHEESSYGRQSHQQQSSYGRNNDDDNNRSSYGRFQQHQQSADVDELSSRFSHQNIAQQQHQQSSGYGRYQEEESSTRYGRQQQQQDDDQPRYGQQSHGNDFDEDHRQQQQHQGYGHQQQSNYGQGRQQQFGGQGRRDDDDEPRRGGGFGGGGFGGGDDNERHHGGGGGSGGGFGGRDQDDDNDRLRRGGPPRGAHGGFGREEDGNEFGGGGRSQHGFGGGEEHHRGGEGRDRDEHRGGGYDNDNDDRYGRR